jgi:staphylococcal nuclease domain-containing protein 1
MKETEKFILPQSETVPLSRIRALPQKFTTLPHQAQEATLSFVKPPSKDEDYGLEALERLQQLAGVST